MGEEKELEMLVKVRDSSGGRCLESWWCWLLCQAWTFNLSCSWTHKIFLLETNPEGHFVLFLKLQLRTEFSATLVSQRPQFTPGTGCSQSLEGRGTSSPLGC